MRLTSAVAALVLGFSAAAGAQQWQEPQAVSPTDLPIRVMLTGWEDDGWMARPWVTVGKDVRHHGDTRQYGVGIRKAPYFGWMTYFESPVGHGYSDTTIRKTIETYDDFKDAELNFGDSGSVSNGGAELRYLMVTFVKQQMNVACTAYRGVWRNVGSQGYLCAVNAPLGTGEAETFLKSLKLGDSTAPVAGSLP